MTTHNRDTAGDSFNPHNPQPRSNTNTKLGRARKRSWLAASLLLLATVAFGAATQGEIDSGGVTIEAPDQGKSVSFRGSLDRTAVLLGGDGLVRMELEMHAAQRPGAKLTRLPTDLVVILDRSGSMRGQKIADARTAVRQLVSQLGPNDRFSLVTFSSGSQLTIPLSHATTPAVAAWHDRINSIEAGGGTFMAPALDVAFNAIDAGRSPGRSPRAILISDGLAAEPHPVLRALATRAAQGEYALSTVGIGSDFDENLMSLLSDAGTGNYYYLADTENLAEIFSNEFETANETVASGLVVHVEPAAGVTVVDASGNPLERSGSTVRFRPGSLFANQKRHVWVTFRVPTDTQKQTELATVQLSYTQNTEIANHTTHSLTLDALPKIACVEEQKDFFAALDIDRWAKSVVVEEYNDLSQRVAAHVKEGRRTEAEQAVSEFRVRNRALNRVAASPSVAAQLDAMVELDESIANAFVGHDQKKKQRLLGKSLHSQSYDLRREGSRK